MISLAKQFEGLGSRQVWPWMDFPFGEVDLVVCAKEHTTVRLFKILNWDRVYQEGDMHSELAELEASTASLHSFLQDSDCFSRNGLIISYLLCPWLEHEPEDCDIRMICGEERCRQVLRDLDVASLRGRSLDGDNNSGEEEEAWTKLQRALNSQPRLDMVRLRASPDTCWWGNFVEFEGNAGLTRQANRQQTGRIEFEHAKQGVLAVPLALVTGVLGWEPTTRVRLHNKLNASVDVAPATKVQFRVFGAGGAAVSCEVNELDSLHLARQSRPV
ncbi:hypothetical protein BASA81_005405 [Batrachochytrium salamandrivorans]|nr:hypothetical protein BASA81_005405 [Batrachochytrium salamandrivorans]